MEDGGGIPLVVNGVVRNTLAIPKISNYLIAENR